MRKARSISETKAMLRNKKDKDDEDEYVPLKVFSMILAIGFATTGIAFVFGVLL